MACSANATELFSECNKLNVSKVYLLATVRGSVSLVCFSLCFITFILEMVYFCRKGSVSTTLRRMFVYLTFSSMLYTAVLSMHLGYKVAQKHCYFCVITGFLDEYTGVVQLCLTFGVVVKLFYKLASTNFCQNRVKDGFSNRHGKAIECSYLLLSFFLPLLITWIPFKVRNGHYGSYGPWCWISRMERDCQKSMSGLMEELLIWYIPFGFVSVLSLLCILVMVAYLVYIYYKVRNEGKMRAKLRTVITDYCLLLPFLIILTMVCLIEVSVVVFKWKYLNMFGAWALYAVITPVGAVAVPIGFLLFFIRKQKDIPVQGGVSVESNAQQTVPPSTRLSPNSYTDQQERNFLSPSDEWTTDSAKEKSPLTFRDTLRSMFSSSNRRYGTMNT